ncbi:MAG TPA: ATP-binding protein [Longimicrobiales bacterium]|nr:ATP-binding protein [Longimicrobiales bacterium]
MGARIQAALCSLGVRLLVPLLLVCAVVLGGHAALTVRSVEAHYRSLVSGEAYRSSGLIRRATHDGMLLNRLAEVQATIERLAEGPEVAAIRVYDREGTVVLSSDRTEIGERLPLESAPCAACHGITVTDERVPFEAAGRTVVGAEEVMRQLSVITNEPECSATGCHRSPDQEAVLGVLDVEMSMLPVQEAMASARQQLIRTTIVLIVVLGLVATVLFRRLIQAPVRSLQSGTRRIAAGDLGTHIAVTGGHELARLAQDFNRMARDLGQAQRELTDWSQTLEEKVVDKTNALRQAQRQVLHMEKMASLGKLSATVAHEINNPISGVLTYARLVERELDEQPVSEDFRAKVGRYLNLIQRECMRCGEIVQNLLVFARGSGSEMHTVDVNEIVGRSLMLVRHHLEMRSIHLDATLLDGDPSLVADAGQLEQALVALCVNAVEAMENGGTLTVTLRGDSDTVCIDIADTGVGIPEEVLPLIFEPFFSTKEDERGVGLGLAVVYGIVHRHGGSIDVRSEIGKGTTFHLCLRRAPQDDAEAGPARAPAAALQPGSTG